MSETVFIFHGRDDAAYASLEDFCTRLGLDAHNFRRVVDGSGPRPTIDIIDESVAKAKAIILLLTPDEYMVLDPRLGAENDRDAQRLGWAPRPNVLFEAGYAFASARPRTILTQFSYPGRNLVALSNIAGINIITLNKEGNATNIPSGAESLVEALTPLVNISNEKIRRVLRVKNFALPQTNSRIVWGEPFRYPIPMMAAAAAVGLGVGGSGVGAAWAMRARTNVPPPLPCPSASMANSAPPPRPPPPATTSVPTPPPAPPSVPTPEPSSLAAMRAALRKCQADLSDSGTALSKSQDLLAACGKRIDSIVPLPPGKIACDGDKCEVHLPLQCCVDRGLRATECK